MRSIQEIFNIVLDAGYYQRKKLNDSVEEYDEFLKDHGICDISYFMCDCLSFAYDDGKITAEEEDYACNEITCYMNTGSTSYSLFHCLQDAGEANDYNARVAIYRNWENRPSLEV